MQRSKQHALMFLLGVFLAGGAVGFSADRVMVRDRMQRCSRWGDQQGVRSRIADDLRLSDDQQASLDRIIDEKHRQMTAILRPVRPQMDSVSALTRVQIRAMLTDEQRVKFDLRLRDQAPRDKKVEDR